MGTKKDFVYLVQGQAKRIKEYGYLRERPHADVIFLTYDVEIEDAIFLPDSTWAEGRNLLLEKSRNKGDYLYYIFMDDDIEFVKGDVGLFEDQLLRRLPGIAAPVIVPKTSATVLGIGWSYESGFFIPLLKCQICHFHDEILLALHRDVVADRLVVPLQTQFDKVSWWCTCAIQQLLLANLYADRMVQFNDVAIRNDAHRAYTKSDFTRIQNEWMNQQFKDGFDDPRPFATNILSVRGLVMALQMFFKNPSHRYFIYTFKALLRSWRIDRSGRHSLEKNGVTKTLRPGSELLQQYLLNHDSPGVVPPHSPPVTAAESRKAEPAMGQ